MIVLPDYDDQRYDDIVETARRKIPVIFPQWTDLNEHDPGITLIELFAWLKEMEQYQLNRITNKSYESMLRLLGVNLKGPAPSETVAVFKEIEEPYHLPAGCRFNAVGDTVFESVGSSGIGKYKIKSAFISDGTNISRVDGMLMENDLNFHMFGESPVEGQSAFYIGFDRFSDNINESEAFELSLYFLLYDNYPVKRNAFEEGGAEPRRIAVEYAVKDQNGISYRPADLIDDKTHAMSLSGAMRIRLGGDAGRLSAAQGMPECFWIRLRLQEQGCEEAPRLIGIYENAVPVIQRRTLCETIGVTAPAGGPFEYIPQTWLGGSGELAVFIRVKDGYKTHQDFKIKPRHDGESRTVVFENLPDDLATDGAENIKIICYEPEFSRYMVLSGSNGLPGQMFPVECDDLVLADDLKVMVSEQTESGEQLWHEWVYIERLEDAGPIDRVFSYNREKGQIVFGDNQNGAVPEAGDQNILIASCVTTAGGFGNILADSLEPSVLDGKLFYPCNLFPSTGGHDGENVKAAVERFRVNLKKPTKAVTASDYETIAYDTPGLRVLGAKAIPYYDPDNKMSGAETPAAVTVVVMPYNETRFPKPDERFLNEVKRYLDRFRLITTAVKVIAPSYIKVSVYAEVVLQDTRDGHTVSDIRTKIEQLFDIHKHAAAGMKISFGESVRENTMISKIAEIPGVNHVKKVTLSVRSTISYRDKYGNIQLPPYAIPYLGELEIRPIDLI